MKLTNENMLKTTKFPCIIIVKYNHCILVYISTEAVSLLSGVKLDPATMKHDVKKMPSVPPHPKSASSSITDTRTPSAKTRATSSSMRQVKTPATLKTYEMPIQPLVCHQYLSHPIIHKTHTYIYHNS
jgi:hypothetical protein